jgi:hypothetical protein
MSVVDNFNIATDLKVEMFLPLDIFNPFILGVSLLGGPDVLDGDLNPQANFDWVPIECEVSNCEIDYGGSVISNLYFQPDSARLNVIMQSDTFDPSFNSSIRPGTKIRIRIDDGIVDHTIFSGFIDTLDVSYYQQAAQVNIIRVIAFDSYKRLVNARLASLDTSALPAGYATPLEQITAVATAAGFTMSAASNALAGKLPLVDVTDVIASNYINDALTVGLGLIWIYPESGEVALKARPSTTTAPPGTYTIGNNHGEALHLCMSDIVIESDANAIYNSLKVALASDPTTYVVTIDEGSITLYGETSTDIEINTTDATELQRWSDAVFSTASTKLVRQVETPTIDRQGNLTEASIFEPGEIVKIKYERTNDTIDAIYVITKVSHSITVDNWFTTLELWRGQ